MKTCTTCGKEYDDETRFCPEDGTTLRSAGGDMVGSVVADRFHIIKKLGEGGMGAVYLGEHVKMGRKSAIKVMTKGMAEDPDAIARFNREAENAARINHPNVCAIYDFGETSDGTIYLAMEFIEGEALTDLLEREGALAPKRASHILSQTAEALGAAHELGIVHRDLKPDNIMIAKDRDGRDLVKVVDFGIAKAMGGSGEQNVTKTGLVVGTPEYMSPEQLSGDNLDGRSDIYSLALVLYRTLTGTLPFQADTSQEVMIKRLTDDPMPLSEALPGAEFPPALQNTMDKALERMPPDRYQSASEFGRDMVAAAAGMADVAPRVDTDGATQQFDGGAVFGGATAQLPQTQVGSAQSAPTEQQEAIPTPRRERTTLKHAADGAEPKKPVALIAIAVLAIVVGGGGTYVMLTRGGDDSDNGPGPQVALNATDSGGVSQDTANPVTPPNNGRSGNDPARTDPIENTDTGQDDPEPDPVVVRNDPDPVVTTPSIAIDAANASLAVIDLTIGFEGETDPRVLSAYRDTLQAYYDNTSDVAHKARADAAYGISMTYFQAGQKAEGLRWIQVAIGMDPNDQAYQRLLDDNRGNA